MLVNLRSISPLVAAVAVVGAGMVDAGPLPSRSTEVQRIATRLVNTADPIFGDPTTVDWATTLNAVKGNVEGLVDRFQAHPFADLTAWWDLQSGYADMIGDDIKQSLAGVAGIWSGDGYAVGLQHLLPQVFETLQSGDAFSAYSMINAEFLYDLLNVTVPFFNRVEFWGSGEFITGALSIPSDELHRLGNVANVYADYMLWAGLANAVLAPNIGAIFQTLQTGQGISELFQAGDTTEALSALFNLPATIANAYLNGYIPPSGGEEGAFTGLLTAGGIFDQLFVTIPQQVADALHASVASAGDAAATIDPLVGLDSLFSVLG